jgi:hypothetical protein
MSFEEENLPDIYKITIENYMLLSCNVNGLCVMKKIVIRARNEETIIKIQEIMIENFKTLIQNAYGNYTIQMAIEYWDNKYLEPVINLFNGNFFTLSTSKFSSNVIEKLLEKGGAKIMAKFIEEVCHKSKVLGKYSN